MSFEIARAGWGWLAPVNYCDAPDIGAAGRGNVGMREAMSLDVEHAAAATTGPSPEQVASRLTSLDKSHVGGAMLKLISASIGDTCVVQFNWVAICWLIAVTISTQALAQSKTNPLQLRPQCAVIRCDATEVQIRQWLSDTDLVGADGQRQFGSILKQMQGCDARQLLELMLQSRQYQLLVSTPDRVTAWPPKVMQAGSLLGRRNPICEGSIGMWEFAFRVNLPWGPLRTRLFNPRWYQFPEATWLGRLIFVDEYNFQIFVDDDGRLLGFDLDAFRTSM